jgi:hypothetical protein
MTKNWKKFTAKKLHFFCIKNYNLPIPRSPERTYKLQKKPSALKRERPALQNMKFLNFFLLLWVIFALLDLDPDSKSGYGTTVLIESGSETQRGGGGTVYSLNTSTHRRSTPEWKEQIPISFY